MLAELTHEALYAHAAINSWHKYLSIAGKIEVEDTEYYLAHWSYGMHKSGQLNRIQKNYFEIYNTHTLLALKEGEGVSCVFFCTQTDCIPVHRSLIFTILEE
jgi:hypothetical protein